MIRVHDENIANYNLTFEQLNEKALTSGDIPSGMDLVNQAAFLALRNIHITWKLGYLTHEDAKFERQKVRNRYVKHCELQAFDRGMIRQIIENRQKAAQKEIEILHKLRAGESVEREALECIGYLLNDKSFFPSALAGIKEREK